MWLVCIFEKQRKGEPDLEPWAQLNEVVGPFTTYERADAWAELWQEGLDDPAWHFYLLETADPVGLLNAKALAGGPC